MKYRAPIFNKFGFIAGYTQKITSRATLAENELVAAMKEAIKKYNHAYTVDEYNRIDSEIKARENDIRIRGRYTAKELKEAMDGAEYNSTWKECYKAAERAAERLGIIATEPAAKDSLAAF